MNVNTRTRIVIRLALAVLMGLFFLAGLGAVLDAVKAPPVVTGIPAAAGALMACWDEPNASHLDVPPARPSAASWPRAPAGSVHFTA